MARTDEAELAIRLEAKIRDFKRNMDRASKKASQSFTKIERDAEKSASNMEGIFARAGKGMANGLKAGIAGVAAIGFAGIVSQARDTAREIANVANEARRAGVSAKAFQELGYVAKVNRVSIDALTDGLKEMTLRADEFIQTGAGGGADMFKRLGFSATELTTKLQDPVALFEEIIDRTNRLNDVAASSRIQDEIFGGTGGEQFGVLIDQGAQKIRALRQEANDLGIVLDDKMIAKADEIDRRFTKITETVGTGLKRAIVEAVDALDGFLDQFREVQRQADFTIAKQLEDIYSQRQTLIERIDDLEGQKADSFFPGAIDGEIKLAQAELGKLTGEAMRLRDVLDRRNGFSESFTFKAGEDAKDAKPKVDDLGRAVTGLDSAGNAGASGINSFADAIRALKGEIPELAEQLQALDAKSRIEGAYQTALSNATSGRQAMEAGILRDKAMGALASKDAREAADKGILDLIGYAEGTDKGRGYNETLSYGAFTGGNRNLVTMTVDEVLAMQKGMLAHPGNGFNSSAVGRYQIVGKTLRGLKKELGLSGSEFFDPELQDRMAMQLLRRRGNDVGGLRNEWEGLRKIDPDTIRRAYDGTSTSSMPAIDPGIADNREKVRTADDATRKARMDANADAAKAFSQNLRDQAKAYGEIVAGSQRYTASQGIERQALSMTAQNAAALRYESEMLADAQRAGLTLTPQQASQIRTLAVEMAQAEQATASFATSQEEARAAQEAFRGIAQNAMGELISDLRAGKSAGEAFANVLNGIADKLIDMALQNVFSNAFSGVGASGGGAGIFGAIGSLFGFKDGGQIPAFATGGKVSGPGGPRDDKILARLSSGEFVVNARSTAKHRALVEAINADRLPAFANGGLAAPRAIRAPAFGSPGSSGGKPISITSNVTINSNGGDPKQNADLARQTSKAVEAQMRVIVQQELRARSRPGGALR